MSKKKISVLIVDDSALVRKTMQNILSSDPMIEVIGSASDPFIAVQKIKKNIPDVITLDIEMPRMDGLTFLKKIMSQHPIPVVIISTLTTKGAETGIKALEYGAVEVIEKPKVNTKKALEESTLSLCRAVKAAAQAKVKKIKIRPWDSIPEKLSADAILSKKIHNSNSIKTTETIIAVGASTGGTEAIKLFLLNLPLNCPGIIITQHMPMMFTKQFADRLNDICNITVKEAVNGDSVLTGQALIAPGNRHMLLKRSGTRYFVEVKDGPLVNRHKPSVDVLFRSVSRYAGKNAIGIILTGMGADGAKGLLEMKEAGARTIAQDEKSCVVFGMPKEAIGMGAADYILPLDEIATKMLQMVSN
jgi:two-component system chemotaxis response regulator CheB